MSLKKVRLDDVAKLAGVSRASAGKVLNGGTDSIRISETTREKILAAAKQLDYQQNIAASMLAGGTSGLIGVLLDSWAQYRATAVSREIEARAKVRGYRVLVSSTHDDLGDMKRNLQTMRRHGTEAVLCLAHRYPGMLETFQREFGKEDDMVFLEKPVLENARYVSSSRETALSELVRDCKARGMERFCTVMSDLFWTSEAALMREFSAALRSNGLECTPEMTMGYPQKRTGIRERAEWVADQILRREKRPQLIFIDDAAHAICIQNMLQSSGIRLPEELVIFGGNDDPFFKLTTPPIHSLNPRYDKIAEALLDLAFHPSPNLRCLEIEAEYPKEYCIKIGKGKGPIK
ncbi:MAG: Catabolite repressor/activator [Lentisphaerae bacterium ADurb.Bin242]|nr:MAG: Catabolite repressor/activator [Lentisphaerae bacterium ADurb.Bin242]